MYACLLNPNNRNYLTMFVKLNNCDCYEVLIRVNKNYVTIYQSSLNYDPYIAREPTCTYQYYRTACRSLAYERASNYAAFLLFLTVKASRQKLPQTEYNTCHTSEKIWLYLQQNCVLRSLALALHFKSLDSFFSVFTSSSKTFSVWYSLVYTTLRSLTTNINTIDNSILTTRIYFDLSRTFD